MDAGTIVKLIVMGLYSVFVIYTIVALSKFRKQKESEYRNDERWKTILAKTDQGVKLLYDGLFCLVALAFLIVLMISGMETRVKLGEILQIVVFTFMLRFPVEYFALRRYDKIM